MGCGASRTRWIEVPGTLFESESGSSGSEVSMPWLVQENSKANVFEAAQGSTDSERVVRDSTQGWEDVFTEPKPKKGSLLTRLVKTEEAPKRSTSPDSLGRVTPLNDESDSGLDSGPGMEYVL